MKTNYGEELKYQRTKRNKTLLQVEADTGISNANLSRWETGKVAPSIDFCVILADYRSEERRVGKECM